MARIVKHELPWGTLRTLAPEDGRAEDDSVAKLFWRHKPKGEDGDLDEAVRLLGVTPATEDDARKKIDSAMRALLHATRGKAPRVADEMKRLEEIETLARSLERALYPLSLHCMAALDRRLPKSSFSTRDGARRSWVATEDLISLATAAKEARQDLLERLGHDKGGKDVTVETLIFGNPYTRFMADLIRLYAEANGTDRVTKTVTRKHSGCYNFLDAVHRYATGKPLGHVTEYKRLVGVWKARAEPTPHKGT